MGKNWKFVIFAITVMTLKTQAQSSSRCTTPNKEIGNCISIYACKPILDILDKTPQPLPPNIIELLKSHHCGFDGRKPKVCCATKSTSDKEGPQPPDVSRHRNIRLLPENCGILDTNDRIVGGNKTGIFEFPWMALLSYKTQNGPDFKCGGTIINERYILTAAHCITEIRFKLLGVRVGEHNIRTPVDCELNEDSKEICAPPYQDLAIEQIIPHPQYNSRARINDIGLLRVTRMDLTQENCGPVCLPLGNTRNYNFTNRNVIVTGWGATETGYNSPDLLKVQLPVVPLNRCKEIYKTKAKTDTIHYRQMCAGGDINDRKDSCSGDSGGPLHSIGNLFDDSRLIQQGIVSYGPRDCGNDGIPGVYTKVAHYMDWILNNMKP